LSAVQESSKGGDARGRRSGAGRRPRPAWLWLAAGISALALVACSVLVDRSRRQCANNDDCSKLSAGSTCTDDGICTLPVGQANCKLGPAQTSEDFANICTNAACIPFDREVPGLDTDLDAGLNPPPDAGAAAVPDAGTTASDAGAPQLPRCLDPSDNRDKVIYLTGSSNFPPLLAKLGPVIMRETGYTPVYQITSSCNGVKSIFSAQGRDHIIADPAAGSRTATATYVTADGTLVPCALGPGGVTVDIGESDIFSSSCVGFGAAAGDIGEYFGPIQAMLFVVPSASSQTVITAALARSVFGRGGDNGKTVPWTDPDLYFVRNANTGTQQMIGRAINVPADQFWGRDRSTASQLAAALTVVASERAEQAIGIISNDYYDRSNGNIKELAYQAPTQSCGFFPDSKQFVKDKRNVRDGHYPIWGPLHFFATISGGVPTSPAAAAFVATVSVAEPGIDLLNAYVDAGLVPSCAMQVQRSIDLGPLSSYTPPIGCGCYFEARLAGGEAPASCQPCMNSNECTDPARPVCNLSFCEAGR